MFKLYQSEAFPMPEADSSLGIYPTTVGHLIAQKDYVCRTRVMDDYFVIYLDAGSGIFRCAGKEYKVAAGDLYFLFPGVPHFYATDPDDCMEQWWVGFNGSSAAALVEKLQVSPQDPVAKGIGAGEMLALMQRMIETKGTRLSGQLQATGCLCELLSLMMERLNPYAAVSVGASKHSRSVLRAHEFIHIHYSQPISMEDVAAHTGLSRAHLSVLFKREMGRTPSEYLAFIRLSHARTLLADFSMPIAKVARSVGFDDVLYFSKFFSLQVGMPPSQFRKLSAK